MGMQTRLRLPAVDATLVMISLKLELERDERGQTWCFEHGVGGMRRKKLGLLPSSEMQETVVESATNEARRILEETCRRCSFDCPLKEM